MLEDPNLDYPVDYVEPCLPRVSVSVESRQLLRNRSVVASKARVNGTSSSQLSDIGLSARCVCLPAALSEPHFVYSIGLPAPLSLFRLQGLRRSETCIAMDWL